MAYVLPEFNLQVNVWHQPHTVNTPPDALFPANLAWSKRTDLPVAGSGSAMHLLLPPLVDIRSSIQHASGLGDVVEVPAGSKRYYIVMFVDDIGKGFPNEHRCAVIEQNKPPPGALWPVPMP